LEGEEGQPMKRGEVFRYKELFDFMHERHQIYVRRSRGLSKPWSSNPIFQQWKFCNIYRELDRVSIWIRENWREPHNGDRRMWFAMAVARYINEPETLRDIGYPVPWKRLRVLRVMEQRQKRGERVFGGAYFLNSIGPKIPSIVNDRLDRLWQDAAATTQRLAECTQLAEAYEVLLSQYGFGSFMAAQVIADIKHTSQFSEKRMSDWWTFAASGPGSKRGLARVFGRALTTTTINYARAPEKRLRASWRESEWQQYIALLKEKIDSLIKKAEMPRLSMSDLQGALCEYDKMERIRLGEGRPKSKYPGAA
jgi:hypothetical protein